MIFESQNDSSSSSSDSLSTNSWGEISPLKHSSTKTIIDDDVSITTVDTDFEPLKDNACNEVSGALNEHIATDYDPN